MPSPLRLLFLLAVLSPRRGVPAPLLLEGQTYGTEEPLFGLHNLIRRFGRLLQPSPNLHHFPGQQVELSRTVNLFDELLNFRDLPPNYHNEAQSQQRVGNATVYSHRQINKETDNSTGEVVFEEKVIASVEEDDMGKSPSIKEEVQHRQIQRPQLNSPPHIAFFLVPLPRRLARTDPPPSGGLRDHWLDNPQNRLMALRAGLRQAPRLHPISPRSHFLYLLRPPHPL
ncbi:dickkopf-like protein 1 isoform X1 [Ornithorhynchus anatinus]|uniref:dickkopf-like protein 1 isoform X1 n=1 Tax=Ornithorhynchus anatinus TaxID=9258 RepID=UPI0010A8FF0A|nr:dickkopf-like protein 1 isoform X1 [Ornithorhynchus anatinus]